MTNDLSQFIAGVDAEEVAAERATLEDLELLYNAKQGVKFWETEVLVYDPSTSDRGKMGRVRAWLHDHEGEPLIDQEKGIRARLLFGGTETVYDPPSAIKERAPHVFQRLLELGCFDVSPERVKKAIADGHLSAGDLAGFVRERERTRKLDIGKVEQQ